MGGGSAQRAPASSAAAVVGELVRTTRQTSAVAQDFESGRRLLERLADDPAAALADPSPGKARPP
jgi:hypothetical protein